jgi:hypothetical protein
MTKGEAIFSSTVRPFTGVPVVEEIPGLSALVFLMQAGEAYALLTNEFPQSITYLPARKVLRGVLPSLLHSGDGSSMVRTPATDWFFSCRGETYNEIMGDFQRRFVPAGLHTSLRAALERVDAAQFVKTRAGSIFSLGEFDVEAYDHVNDKLMTALEFLLGPAALTEIDKYIILQRQFQSAGARSAWEYFVRQGTRDYQSWIWIKTRYQDDARQMPALPPFRQQPLRVDSRSESGASMSDWINDRSAGNNRRDRSWHQNRSSFHSLSARPGKKAVTFDDMQSVEDLCGDCNLSIPQFSSMCPCCDVPEFISENIFSALDVAEADVISCFHENLDEFHVLTGQQPRTPADPTQTKCAICEELGHFARDCPEEGGSGESTPGARFGSARGFKRGDDPKDRNPKYLAWRKTAQQLYAAKRPNSAQMRAKQPRGSGGKFATHARRIRTGHADQPVDNKYQTIRRLNVLLADEAEELGVIRADSLDVTTSQHEAGGNVFNQLIASCQGPRE